MQFPGSAPQLTGTVDLPGEFADLTPTEFREAGVPVALVAHCFTCHRKVPAAFRISKTLARAGIACLRFDFPGLGDSQGRFEETTFSSQVADIRSAATWLADRLAAPSLLVGHSLGGAAALRAAGHIPSLSAVATVGAPFRPASAARSLLDAVTGIDRDEVRTVRLTGRDVPVAGTLLRNLAEQSEVHSITEGVAALKDVGPELLILHSPQDRTVPVTEAVRIFEVAPWPKSLISLDDSDHLLSWPGSAQRAGQTIAQWALPRIGQR